MNGGIVGLPDTIARAGVGFPVQSTVLIAAALIAARRLAKTAAMRSAIYRATLLAVVALPVVSVLLLGAGLYVGVVPLPEGRSMAAAGPLVVPAEGTALEGVRDERAPEAPAVGFWIPETPWWHALPAGVAGYGCLALALAWAAGTGFSLVSLLRSHRAVARMRRLAQPVSDDRLLAELKTAAERAGVRPPELLVSREAQSPFLTGFARPAILLPESVLRVPAEALRAVLVHELAHQRKRDCLVLLLARVATAVFCIQPLIRLLVRRMEEASDEATDDLVLAAGIPRTGYARDLTDWAERFLPAPREALVGVGVFRFGSSLARRVRRILDAARPLQTALPWKPLLAVGLAVAATCATAGAIALRYPRFEVDVQAIGGPEQTLILADSARAVQWLRVSQDPLDDWLLWPYRGGRKLAFREAGQCIVVNQDGEDRLAGPASERPAWRPARSPGRPGRAPTAKW